MLAHILTLLLLGLYAHEIGRTVQRFGQRRAGITGTVVSSPKAHIVMGAVLTLAGFGIWKAGWGPIYAGPGMGLISLTYLGAGVRFFLQTREEDENTDS